MAAEIADCYHHCVILISLTVSDAAGLGKRYGLNPRRLSCGLSALLVLGVFPYAGAGPDGGLMPSKAAEADGAPIV